MKQLLRENELTKKARESAREFPSQRLQRIAAAISAGKKEGKVPGCDWVEQPERKANLIKVRAKFPRNIPLPGLGAEMFAAPEPMQEWWLYRIAFTPRNLSSIDAAIPGPATIM